MTAVIFLRDIEIQQYARISFSESNNARINRPLVFPFLLFDLTRKSLLLYSAI